MRHINRSGFDLIREFEAGPHGGPALRSYLCPAGIWTIGYGHTRTAKQGMTITPEQADTLLLQDLSEAERIVEDYVDVRLTDNQFAALVSFAFNVGAGSFSRSTLLRVLNAGEYGLVPDQLKRWVRANGKVLAGLVRRRKEEATLWSTPDGSIPPNA